jgi:hypothetical protein
MLVSDYMATATVPLPIECMRTCRLIYDRIVVVGHHVNLSYSHTIVFNNLKTLSQCRYISPTTEP